MIGFKDYKVLREVEMTRKWLMWLMMMVFAVLLPTAAWGATVTVCSSGCDYTSITSAISGVSNVPGTIIEVHSGIYAEAITLQGSGTSASIPLTLRGRNGDIVWVSGSVADDGSSGWTGPDGNGEYYKTYATEPLIVLDFATGIPLEKGTVGSLGATEWGYDTTELYLGFNPVGNDVFVGQRIGLDTNDQDYWEIRNLGFFGCQGNDGANLVGALNIEDTSIGIIIDGCILTGNRRMGISVKGGTSFTISNNTIRYQWCGPTENSADGIYVTSGTGSPTGTITGNTIGQDGADTIHRMGIAVVDGDDITISNNTISGGRTGIDIEPNVGQTVNNITITGNTIDKPANTDARGGSDLHKGISVLGNSGTVSGLVTVTNNVIDLQNEAMGTDCDGIMYLDLASGVSVRQSGNIVRDVGDGLVISGCTDIQVDRDRFTGGSGVSRFAVIFPDTAGKQSAQIVIQNCVFSTFPYGMHLNEDNGAEVNFFNNTLYLSGEQQGIYIKENVAGNDVELKNNIFGYVAGTNKYYVNKVGANATLDADFNCYLNTGAADWWAYEGSGRTWTEWTVTEGMDASGLNADPLFISPASGNFQLQGTSPCIDAGTNSGVTTDFMGRVRPLGAGYDIGAYEYSQRARRRHAR